MPSFFDQTYALAAQVPKGRVISYGGLARLPGRPRGARAVGWAMRRCPQGLPWHRVLKADGAIADGAQADLQRRLLQIEGVPFLPDGRVDMSKCLWP